MKKKIKEKHDHDNKKRKKRLEQGKKIIKSVFSKKK